MRTSMHQIEEEFNPYDLNKERRPIKFLTRIVLTSLYAFLTSSGFG
jgi:hypothetical protein